MYSLSSHFDKDLRNEVVVKLLESISNGAFTLDNYTCDKGKKEAYYKVMNWLVLAFQRECNVRIRSRLPKKSPTDRGGDKMLYGSSYKESDYAGGLHDNEGSVFDFNSLPDKSDVESDVLISSTRDKLIDILGEDKEVLVDQFLAGFSYMELAQQHGGSPDKYRKMFVRAREKMTE